MVALYRSGRQADALEVYRRTRARLVDELGIEPGEELQELHRAILRHDDSLVVPRRRPARSARRSPRAAPALGARRRRGGAGDRGARDGLCRHAWRESGSESHAPFVHKLEGFLDQSSHGRQQVIRAIHGATRARSPGRRR